MTRPLEGILVIGLEQAVAAPACTCRLADAGARVIKIERPEGDVARTYDALARGQCSYFVWLNRGKESVVLDLARPHDAALLEAMLGRADVFVQNLKPGATEKLGFSSERLRIDYPSLIVCSISGYGERGPYAERKAYDLLVQAEVGLAHVTGGPEAPARVGVSVVDFGTGMAAYAAILEALLVRARTGKGAVLSVSMFDTAADWMTVPLLQYEGGVPPRRIGLAHPSIAPYGVFASKDGVAVLISVQNDREWQALAGTVLADAALASDPDFATNAARVRHREVTDRRVAGGLATMDIETLSAKLTAADLAFARINDLEGLARHPQLRRIMLESPGGPLSCPAPPLHRGGERDGAIPALGEHTERVRAEFLGGAAPR